MAVHAVGFPCASGQQGFGDDINLQYEIQSYITAIVVKPNRDIAAQFYGPDVFPMRDTLNNLLLSLGAEMLDCTVNTEEEHLSSQHNSLRLFPNPTNGITKLNIKVEKAGNHHIEIFNTFGVLIQSLSTSLIIGENYEEIDFGDLPAGLYHIRIRNRQNIIINKKILKQ